MSKDISSILVSFGAAVDDNSFRASLSKLKAFLNQAAKNLASGDVKGKNNFVDHFMSDLLKLDKVAKDKIPAIRKIVESVFTSKDPHKAIDELIAKIGVLQKETKQAAALEGALVSGKKKTVVGGTSEGTPYVKAKEKLDILYQKDLERSKFLRQAYKHTVGKVEPENMAQLQVASKEFKKFFESEFRFGKITGNQNWSDKTTFNKVFEGISDKTIRFDRDLGFFTARIADGAKALGVTQETIRKTQQLAVDGLNAAKKVLDMDTKSGTTRGKSAIDQLSLFYGKGAAGADVYGGPLLQAMKLMQTPTFQKMGVGGSAADITNAALQGNISLTSRSFKVHNEEGLKALKITEDFAIKQGLLSNQFKGTGYDLQRLNAAYNKLSEDQKKAFAATGADMKNVASFKAGMEAVKKASADAVKSVQGNFNLASSAVAHFTDQASKKLTANQKLFQSLYSTGSDKTRSAMDAKLGELGSLSSPQIGTYLKNLKDVERAIAAKSLAMGEDARASNSYYQTTNRNALVQEILANRLKVVGDRFVEVKEKMTASQKVMEKHKGMADNFKDALAAMMKVHGATGQPLQKEVSALMSWTKKIDEAKKQMNLMGKDGDAWAKAINLKAVMLDGGVAGKKLKDQLDSIGKDFDRLHGKGGLLKRSLTDLFEKFKILAGYAVSGSIVYGLGNAMKNAVTNVMAYDQALKDLQAITQSTNYDTKKMGEEIFRVATTTKFSVIELADGMKILGQTGMNAQEAIRALEPIAELATATLSDFATINDLVTTTLGAFDLQDTDTARVIDVFGAAINKSKLNVEKLRVAMNYVGPIAKDAGLSLEEVAAAMGLFANSGLRASTIGTAFRQIISKLMSPTDDFKKAVEGAGYSMDEVNPRIVKFSDIVGKLVHIVPDAENAFKFFGQRASSAISVLTKAGSSGFLDMQEKMYETGLVAIMAATQMEGAMVKAKNLSDTLGVMSIKSAQAFGIDTMIKGTITTLKDVLSGVLNLTEGWGSLIATMIKTGVVVTGAVLAWKSLTVALPIAGVSTLTLAINGATSALVAFKAASIGIGAASMPLWGFILAVSAATAAIATFIGVYRPFDSAIEKSARKIENETVILNTNISAHEKKTHAVKGLVRAMEDGKRPLSERVNAYFQLKSAGVELDGSIRSNITSVSDFDAALNNSRPAIEAYIKSLDEMGQKYKESAFSLRIDRYRNAGEGQQEALKTLSDDGAKVPLFSLGDKNYFWKKKPPSSKKKQEAESVFNDKTAERKAIEDATLKDLQSFIDENQKFVDAIKDTQRKYDNKEFSAVFSQILEAFASSVGKDSSVVLELLGEKFDPSEIYFSEAALKQVTQEDHAAQLKAIPKIDRNSTKSLEIAKENIGRLSLGLAANQKAFRDELIAFARQDNQHEKLPDGVLKELITGGFGDQLISYLKENPEVFDTIPASLGNLKKELQRVVNADTAAIKSYKEETYKQFNDMKSALDQKMQGIELVEKTRLAELKKNVNTPGGISEDAYLEAVEGSAVRLAKARYDNYREAVAVLLAAGPVSAEMMEIIKNQEREFSLGLMTAEAEYAQGKKRLGEKNRSALNDSLRKQLKSAHDAYTVATEKLETEKRKQLDKNREINQFNQEAEKAEEFRIEKEFGEKKLLLIQELMQRERAIRDSGGTISSEKKGAVELEKHEQDSSKIETDERLRQAEIARRNAEERRKLELEYNNFILQDKTEFLEKSQGLERLAYQQKRAELGQQYLEGKMDYRNYLLGMELEKDQHDRRIKEIDREATQMRLEEQASLMGSLAGMMGEFYSASNSKAVAFFYAQKALTIAEILMNTHAGAAAALGDGPFGIPMSALITALGYAKAGMVAGLTVARGAKGFADGGEVVGHSPHDRADNIPIWVTAKEFIQPVPSVEYYGKGVMEAIRTRSIPREVLQGYNKGAYRSAGSRAADGGYVGGGNHDTVGNTNNVVVNIHGGDEESVKKALPELVKAVKRAVGDDIRNNGELRKVVMNYAR